MRKMHAPFHDLGIACGAKLVISQFIGMDQINHFVGFEALVFAVFCLNPLKHT